MERFKQTENEKPSAIEQRTHGNQARALRSWLGELELAEFRARYLQRQPFATPGRAIEAIAACDWRELDRLLAAGRSDVLVVARSKLLSLAPPGSLADLQQLFRAGIGLAVRNPAPYSAGIHAITSALARELPGDQRVIVFATPKRTNGFGWHYDPEDVFIVQTAGDKEYFFRPNTLVPEPERGAQPDFGVFERERSPLMSCRLLPGDFLYLPRGFWHCAYAHEDSLSLSIGVFPEVG